MTRCFIAIDLPENVKKQVLEIQEKLPEFKGKKTEIKNLHLTLKFLGEVDEKLLKKVEDRLKGVSFKKFEAEISERGVFREDFVKIVWLKMSNCDALQKEIDDSLESLFEKESVFMGHLTIARVKFCERESFLKSLKKIKTKNIKFQVDRFKLKKSDLTRGAIYTDLLEVELE